MGVLRCSVAIGLSAGLILSGCSSDKPAATAGEQVTLSPRSAPGGELDHFTWSVSTGEPVSLDPAKAGDETPYSILGNLCDSLLRLNDDWSVSPNLAQSFEHPDPKTWIYDLRPDVKFWDGSPVTPDDVVFSLKRQQQGDVNSPFFKYIDSITATGDHQVTVKLTEPFNLFNTEMAAVPGQVFQKKYVEEHGDAFGTPSAPAMCSGPMILDSWDQGSKMELKRNDDYWNVDQRAKAKSVTVKFVTDTAALTAALSSGAIDGSYEVPASAVKQLTASGQGRVLYGPSLQYTVIIPGGDALKDPDVRKALSLSIDREAIAKVVYGGAATPSKTLITPTAWGSEPDVRKIADDALAKLPELNVDVDAAKKLLANKGPLAPIVLSILGDNATNLQLATIVQSSAKAIGLDVQIKPLTDSAFISALYTKEGRAGIDGIIEPIFFDVANPLNNLIVYVYPDSYFNYIGYSNPMVQKEVTLAANADTPVEMAQHVVAAQAQYTADTMVIPIVNPYEISFLNKRLTGAPTSFAYVFQPWAAQIGAAS